MASKKAPTQVSEIQIRYKKKVKVGDSPRVRSATDAAQVLRDNWDDDLGLVETFYILCLNRANRVKGMMMISKGGVSGTVVDAKVIFGAALRCMASSIILAHNHPSGNLFPSLADQQITKKLVQAGELLDIVVLDHLIVTEESYYSFADEGELK